MVELFITVDCKGEIDRAINAQKVGIQAGRRLRSTSDSYVTGH